MTVTHARGTLVDGTDTLRNVERLSSPTRRSRSAELDNQPPTGTVEHQRHHADREPAADRDRAFNDADGVNRSTLEFAWQIEEGDGAWTTVALGSTFTPSDEEVGSPAGRGHLRGQRGRAREPRLRGDPGGDQRQRPGQRHAALSDTTPQAGVAVTALTGRSPTPTAWRASRSRFQWQAGRRQLERHRRRHERHVHAGRRPGRRRDPRGRVLHRRQRHEREHDVRGVGAGHGGGQRPGAEPRAPARASASGRT